MLDINRAYFAISNSPGTSGNFTVSTAQTDFRTLGAAHDGGVFDGVRIEEDGLGWEVRNGCSYTNSTTTLTRGTLEDSSSGSAINFTSAATISIGNSALFASRARLAMQAVTPGGRLTLESGVPVSTTDQTAKTNVYYTPTRHNIITLWDGNAWVPVTFSEITHALGTVTSGIGYDFFAYLSGGALAIEKLAWTSATARATAVTLQDGRYCKSGDKTRLLLGSIYTASTTTTEDSVNNRFVSNVYNRVPRRAHGSSAESHTYTTGAFREWNAGTNVTRAQWFAALAGESVELTGNATISGTYAKGHVAPSGNGARQGTAYLNLGSGGATDLRVYMTGFCDDVVGLNYATCEEYGSTGTTYATFAVDACPNM